MLALVVSSTRTNLIIDKKVENIFRPFKLQKSGGDGVLLLAVRLNVLWDGALTNLTPFCHDQLQHLVVVWADVAEEGRHYCGQFEKAIIAKQKMLQL